MLQGSTSSQNLIPHPSHHQTCSSPILGENILTLLTGSSSQAFQCLLSKENPATESHNSKFGSWLSHGHPPCSMHSRAPRGCCEHWGLHHLAAKPSPLTGTLTLPGQQKLKLPPAHGGAKPDQWNREQCPAQHWEQCGNIHGTASRRALLMAAAFLFNWQRNRVNQQREKHQRTL